MIYFLLCNSAIVTTWHRRFWEVIRVLPEDDTVSAETCTRFSKQYIYSIVHVYLVVKLKIYLLYENAMNGKRHDYVYQVQ